VGQAKDFYDDDYADDEEDDISGTQLSAQSEPQTSSNVSTRATKRAQTKHLKNPAQACEIMMKNMELFQKALEAKQQNRYRLVNENLCNFQTNTSSLFEKLEKSQQTMNKTLTNVVNEISSLIKFKENNTPLAIKMETLKKSQTAKSPIDLTLDDEEDSTILNKVTVVKLEREIKTESGQMSGQMVHQMVDQICWQMGQIGGQMIPPIGDQIGWQMGQISGQMIPPIGGQMSGQISGQMGHQIGWQMGQMGHQMGHQMSQMSGHQMSQMNGQMGGQMSGHTYNGCGGVGPGQTNANFGASNLMAGLGCIQFDANNNPKPKIDIMELVKACRNFSKPTLIAGAAFEFFYKFELDNNIFCDGNYNVYGLPPNGAKQAYMALERERMDALETFVRDRMEQGVNKDDLLKKCVKAINRKLWKLNAKNKGTNLPDGDDDE
jgi:hypothetical protein